MIEKQARQERDVEFRIEIYEPPEPDPEPDPCRLGHHRWAWLTDGGQACGYCGIPR